MGFAAGYLEKHLLSDTFIVPAPHPGTSIIVVIPSLGEKKLINSLESLYSAEMPSFPVEVIVVVNAPEDAEQEIVDVNRHSVEKVREWDLEHGSESFRVHVIDAPFFPRKHAGAGYARKTGMDEAVYRFNLLNNEKGIIVSFDADSVCDSNYFTELEKCFSDPAVKGCTIYFEHPLSGSEEPQIVYEAVACYELYLRYFVQALRFAGYPMAFHTIGSCFAVNAEVYAVQGGMNRKTAGEDFYFLHKIFPLGGFRELNTTRVVPSSRVSGRVPFGTGAAISKYAAGDRSGIMTYSIESFKDLSALFDILPYLFDAGENEVEGMVNGLPACLGRYLTDNQFYRALREMKLHSAGSVAFTKRFYSWFNALRVIRFLNYARESCYEEQPVDRVAGELLYRIDNSTAQREIPVMNSEDMDLYWKDLLLFYRALQRGSDWKC